jgi:RNA polymerase sigma-70 factor, ECF subfamily
MSEPNVAPVLPVVGLADPVERLASLFDDHHERLYRLARRLTGRADDALDLVQETFLRAAKSPNSVPFGCQNEEAWLVRVLINIRRDQWRKQSVRDLHTMAALDSNEHHPSGIRKSEEHLIAKALIWQGLNALTPRRRAIVVMYELEGVAVPAIASLLGIRAVTVRWHLSIGRRDLARALKPFIGGIK